MEPAQSESQLPDLTIDLRQAIYALTDALDLVGVDEVGHGKRVGCMAAECGRALELPAAALQTLFHAALLHDCGVSSTRVHQHLVEEMEWENAQEHCRVGYELLCTVPPLASLAPIILYHHTRWADLLAQGVTHEVALLANLIFLVDRVDALTAPHYGKNLLLARAGVQERISACRDTLFAPELVELFLRVSAAEAFWLTLEPPHLGNYLLRALHEQPPLPVDFSVFKRLAQLFAHIVDAKSHYTAQHSAGVARLARYIAEQKGLAPARCEMVEVAGLLHDLGKLKVPDEILEKPAAMSGEEREVMTHHSFESYQILRRIDGIEEIAIWAAYHHETPSGHGYPFHTSGTALGVEARIVAVADVFQALAQDRPYRDSLPPEAIGRILARMAAEGRLDQAVVDLVVDDAERCWQQAV